MKNLRTINCKIYINSTDSTQKKATNFSENKNTITERKPKINLREIIQKNYCQT